MAGKLLSQERLRELLQYDPETGVFTRLINNGPRSRKGTEFGCVTSQGYRWGMIDGRHYLCHRLAWFYSRGEWPKVVDHIDGDRLNNRLSNLRDVGIRDNNQNHRKATIRSLTGILGVSQRSGKFQAGLKVGDFQIKAGPFDTADAAYAVYITLKRAFHEGTTL